MNTDYIIIAMLITLGIILFSKLNSIRHDTMGNFFRQRLLENILGKCAISNTDTDRIKMQLRVLLDKTITLTDTDLLHQNDALKIQLEGLANDLKKSKANSEQNYKILSALRDEHNKVKIDNAKLINQITLYKKELGMLKSPTTDAVKQERLANAVKPFNPKYKKKTNN